MRVLLRPVLVPELGLVVLKPGRESIQIFHNPRVLVEPEPKSMRNLPSGVVPAVRQPLAEDKTLLPFFSNERVIRAAGARVLVEPEPKSMRNLPSGVVPAVRQPLAEDKTLLPFFSNERVIRAAGGVGALSDWLLRHVTSCQWPNGDYHHTETVIHRYGTGATLAHCPTGYYVMLHPASGLMAITITLKQSFTVMVPAQWCCAGTATTNCVTRHRNHWSCLLNKI